VIDYNPIRAYKRYKINTKTFRAMGVESPPKYVNRELNSQIGIRSQDSHFSESDGAPPTSMLLWDAGTTALECGTAALAVTAQIRTDTTQHVIHIKIYILAQLYHKRHHRLIYVHIPHIYKVLK